MTPAEFVARDAITFWVGTAAVVVPVLAAAWVFRRRLVAAVDRFWDRHDPQPDRLAAARSYAESMVGQPYQWGPPPEFPDKWRDEHGQIDPVKVNETIDQWEAALKQQRAPTEVPPVCDVFGPHLRHPLARDGGGLVWCPGGVTTGNPAPNPVPPDWFQG